MKVFEVKLGNVSEFKKPLVIERFETLINIFVSVQNITDACIYYWLSSINFSIIASRRQWYTAFNFTLIQNGVSGRMFK